MKVEIISIDKILLRPESDSDEALLDTWSEQTCHIAASSHTSNGGGPRSTTILVGFKESKDELGPPNPRPLLYVLDIISKECGGDGLGKALINPESSKLMQESILSWFRGEL